MIVVIAFGKCLGVLNPLKNLIHVVFLPFGHYPHGRIEQGCQKNKSDGNGQRVQMRYADDDHCHERVDGERTRPVEQVAQPAVRPSVRGRCGTYNGREHDTEIAGVSVRIDIVVQEQHGEQYPRVEFAGLFVADHSLVESVHETTVALVQCRCYGDRYGEKQELQYNPSHR